MASVTKFPLRGGQRGQANVAGANDEIDDYWDEDEFTSKPKSKKGSPAWMATFADIATNLMAFFVLILGFAKLDQHNFEKVASSIVETFGTRVSPSILPNPEGSLILNLQLPTGSRSQYDQAAELDDPPSDDGPDEPVLTNEAATEVAELVSKSLANGTVEVEKGFDRVIVRVPDDAELPAAEEIAEILSIMASDGPQQTMPDAAGTLNADVNGQGQVDSEASSQNGRTSSPGFAAAKLALALKEQRESGLIHVERKGDVVVVSLGSAGAFESGSTELTAEAEEMIGLIAEVGVAGDALVTVTGHTDNVPLNGSTYTDNLELGAARAASVVRSLVSTGAIDPTRISAVSKGEFEPIAPNDTAEGREANRRVEIEIEFPKPIGR